MLQFLDHNVDCPQIDSRLEILQRPTLSSNLYCFYVASRLPAFLALWVAEGLGSIARVSASAIDIGT